MNLATLIVLSTLWATVPYNITPQAISAQIASRGAATVLKELYDDEDVWSDVLEHIGTGESNWLNIGASLHKASDAGSSEDLEVAFFFALNHSATQVLRMSSPEEMSQICSSNFLIDNRADKTSLSWVDERLKRVKAVKDPLLLQERSSCITGLIQARKIVLRWTGHDQ
jgi:hypothetical protein